MATTVENLSDFGRGFKGRQAVLTTGNAEIVLLPHPSRRGGGTSSLPPAVKVDVGAGATVTVNAILADEAAIGTDGSGLGDVNRDPWPDGDVTADASGFISAAATAVEISTSGGSAEYTVVV